MNKTRIGIIVLLALAIPASAWAQDRERRTPREAGSLFEDLDVNADGKLSREEIPDPRMLESVDLNNDGFVTPDEVPGSSRGESAIMERFERTAPAIGETLPDLPVYDPEGNKLALLDLTRGHFTVLVFGCLT